MVLRFQPITDSLDRRPPTREIRAGGTVARVAFGAALLAWAVADGIGVRTPVVAGTLVVGVSAAQLVLPRQAGGRIALTDPVLRCLGQCAAIAVPIVLVQFDLTRAGTLVFYGVSAVIAAARGVAGCEVTVIPNWVLGRHDRVGCPLFTPLDTLEATRSTRTGRQR